MEIRNNVQSPNFGMALRINKGARKALEKRSMETIEKLQKAGEQLKDTKFYHIEVGDDLTAKITADKDAYFGFFKTKDHFANRHGSSKTAGVMVPDDRIIMIENNVGTIAGVGRYVPLGEIQPFFNTWGAVGAYNTVEDVPQLSKIAKILDNVAVKKYAERAAAESAQEVESNNVAKAVGKLLDTFGE